MSTIIIIIYQRTYYRSPGAASCTTGAACIQGYEITSLKLNNFPWIQTRGRDVDRTKSTTSTTQPITQLSSLGHQ